MAAVKHLSVFHYSVIYIIWSFVIKMPKRERERERERESDLLQRTRKDLIKETRYFVLLLDAFSLKSLMICLFVLRFYGPVNPMGSCRVRSVYLTTRLLGRLSPVSG